MALKPFGDNSVIKHRSLHDLLECFLDWPFYCGSQSASRGLWEVLTRRLPLRILFPALINLLGSLFPYVFYFFILCFLQGFFLLFKKPETDSSEQPWQFSWRSRAVGTPDFSLTRSGPGLGLGGDGALWGEHGGVSTAAAGPSLCNPQAVPEPLSGCSP